MQDFTMNRDGLLKISLMGGEARAYLIEATQMVETARKTHNLSRVATAALGRTLMATSMMGAMLKGENESLTATIKGGGPLGTVLAVGRANGNVKGYVDYPDVDLPRVQGEHLPVGAAVGKKGGLTIVKDLGMRQPYVGQVDLVSGEIAEDFAMYFTASEQTPSLVSLGVLVGETVVSAGGLIIQMMPGASEAAIKSVEYSADMFRDISKTMQEYHLKDALPQLLMHLEPEVLDELHPRYLCDCSRERMEKALIALGRQELTAIINEEHEIDMDCHFCNKRRHFTEQDLRTLLEQASDRRNA